MNYPVPTESSRRGLLPLVAAAAIAVIVMCSVGVAAAVDADDITAELLNTLFVTFFNTVSYRNLITCLECRELFLLAGKCLLSYFNQIHFLSINRIHNTALGIYYYSVEPNAIARGITRKKRAKVLLFFELTKFLRFFLCFSCIFTKKAVLLHRNM